VGIRNKKTRSDTKRTSSVTFINSIVLILSHFLEKYLYGK
jgi:hypothetical protein